jgi:hypothetical protein
MAKKGKKKQGAPQAKRGAPDHFKGFKRQFLDSFAILYQQALDSNKPKEKTKEFYDKITRDFVAKYGDHEPFALEPAEDPPDPAGDEPTVYTDEDEALIASERWSRLRTVSSFRLQQVSDWC